MKALRAIFGETNSNQLWQGLLTKSRIPTSYLNLAACINLSSFLAAPNSIRSNNCFKSSYDSGTLICPELNIISNCGFNETSSKKSAVVWPKSEKKDSIISGIQYQLGPISNLKPSGVENWRARPPGCTCFSKTCTS
ncbi:hypothetical protein D3C73_1135800 [compost metagenome]